MAPKLDHLITPGHRIRWLRETKNMQQFTLAKAIGISPTALSKIELGKSKSPASYTLLRIAAHLDANPEWIMHGKGHPFKIDTAASTTEMFVIFEQLSPAHQAAILAAAKSLL